MFNRQAVPGISVAELAVKLDNQEAFIILDVREPHELVRAQLQFENVALAPLSKLSRSGPEALPEVMQDKTGEIIVMCHHGNRSAQVTTWLRSQGWENVFNMNGGIAAYAAKVDPSVGTY